MPALKNILIGALAVSVLLNETEAKDLRQLFVGGGRHPGARTHTKSQYERNQEFLHKKEREAKKEEERKEKRKKALEEEAEKREKLLEEKMKGDQLKQPHFLHKSEQEKFDKPVTEIALTPEEYEKQKANGEAPTATHAKPHKIIEETPAPVEQNFHEEHHEKIEKVVSKKADGSKKSRKLWVPIRWTQQEQNMIQAMLFSFTGVLVTFFAVLVTCFLCSKHIKKPMVKRDSVFLSSFVEEEAEPKRSSKNKIFSQKKIAKIEKKEEKAAKKMEKKEEAGKASLKGSVKNDDVTMDARVANDKGVELV